MTIPWRLWTLAMSEWGLKINVRARKPFIMNATGGAASSSSTACQRRRWNRSTIRTASIVRVSMLRMPLQLSMIWKALSDWRI
jgi:hypothetical protein